MATKKEVENLHVYELGSHIVSSIPEEQVGKEYEGLKDLVRKAGGEIISEESPRLIDLAYTMVKHVHGKNARHTTAYFSWIKFEIDSSDVQTIQDAVSKDENILRFIIVKTVRENTLHGQKFAHEPKEGKEGGSLRRESKREETDIPKVKPTSDAEVDQVIEDIVK